MVTDTSRKGIFQFFQLKDRFILMPVPIKVIITPISVRRTAKVLLAKGSGAGRGKGNWYNKNPKTTNKMLYDRGNFSNQLGIQAMVKAARPIMVIIRMYGSIIGCSRVHD